MNKQEKITVAIEIAILLGLMFFIGWNGVHFSIGNIITYDVNPLSQWFK